MQTLKQTRSMFWPGILCLLLYCPGAASGNSNEVEDAFVWTAPLKEKLTEMGLALDVTNASRAAVLALVKTLDAQARLVEPDEWELMRAQAQGWHYQAGVRLTMSNGLPVVLDVTGESASATNGLAPGDLLIGIGSNLFDRTSLPRIQEALQFSTSGTAVVVYVRRENTNHAEVVVERRRMPGMETVELFPNDIGYIKVNGLYAGIGRDLVSQFRSWSENRRTGAVLDLRGAGGDDDDSVVQVASLFTVGGQFLYAYRDHHNQDLSLFKATEGNPIQFPVMVLIDRQTRGAAEILAAVLHSSARSSLLVGEGTAGDFNLREAIPLAGHWVVMAARVMDTSDGWRYNGQFGLEPDVVVPEISRVTHEYEPAVNLLDRRQRMEVEERDKAVRSRVRGDGTLERALDILIGLKTLNKDIPGVSSPPP